MIPSGIIIIIIIIIINDNNKNIFKQRKHTSILPET